MGYLVLARKWRPKSFQEMVGQTHILQMMTNALTQNRLHHAYLFCGTRGVGKTTLARIFAKCLNCETGITATPCNQCQACQDIDAGRFVDLIEIDAASRTKVEDTRELLDNVQYAPTAGRYKVYLIDEVHMLSGHSFNALLKTLEEPPEHVKFLLATTDPQKLPITVLSRCLKLQLKWLEPDEIQTQLLHILKEEHIPFEEAALPLIAHAARGSMRDALSLLDQAIAYGAGHVKTDDVTQMLGLVSETYIDALLQALADKDHTSLMETANTMMKHGVDMMQAAEALQTTLYYISLAQIMPDSLPESLGDTASLKALAKRFSPEEVQLYYQIALMSKNDLSLAPTFQIGFEMMLLRMAAFSPSPTTTPLKTAVPPENTPSKASDAPKTGTLPNSDNWHQFVETLAISGVTRAIAQHSTLAKTDQNELQLLISEAHSALCNESQQRLFSEAVSAQLGRTIRVRFIHGKPAQETPLERQTRISAEAKVKAQQSIQEDPHVQEMMQRFGASLDTASTDAVNK